MPQATSRPASAGAASHAHVRVSIPKARYTRSDGAMDDDFKTWVHVLLLSSSEPMKPRPRLWYTTDTELNFGKTSVTNGSEPAYNFARQSKGVLPTSDVLTELATTSLLLVAYRGGNRDTRDQVIGWHAVELAPLINGDKVKGTFDLRPPASLPPGVLHVATASPVAYTGAVTVEVRADTMIEEACLGSRIVTIPALSIAHVPRRWRLPAAEAEDESPEDAAAGSADAAPSSHDAAALTALCNDADENHARYVLSFGLPVDASGAESRQVHLASGTLRYVPATATTTAVPASAAGAPAHKWAVEWRASKLFLERASVQGLQHHIGTGRGLACTLRRVITEVVEEDDPADTVFSLEPGRRLLEEDYAFRAKVDINLDKLLAAGATNIDSEMNVLPITVGEEERAADATAKAARDAAWTEHLAAKAKAGGGKAGAAKGKGAPAKGAKPAAKDASKGKPAEAKPAAAAKGKDDGKGGKAGGKGGKGADKKDTEREEENAAPPAPPPHPYVGAGTILCMQLALNAALTPRPPTPPPVALSAADLVPPRGPAPSLPPGLDASQEFRREVANAAVAIAREFSGVLQRSGATDGADATARRDLLLALKSSGQYERMKTVMKGVATKIVQERFVGMPGSMDAPGTRGKDMFITHVYAYLVGQMHAALNAVFAEADNATALAPLAAAVPSIGASLANDASGGSGSTARDSAYRERLARVAEETEFAGQLDRSARLHQMAVTAQEEAAATGRTGGVYDASVWYSYAAMCARRGDLLTAYTLLREAIGSDAGHLPSLLCMAAVQSARGLHEEAGVFAASAVDAADDNLLPLAHSLHAATLTAKGRNEDAGRALHAATASLAECLRSLGILDDDIERAATVGAVYLILSRYLLSLHLHDLARHSLELAGDNLEDTDAPRCQRTDVLVLRARHFLVAHKLLVTREVYPVEAAMKAIQAGSHSARSSHACDAPVAAAPASSTSAHMVPVSVSGAAYDGAVITGAQCRAALEKVLEMDAKHSEAWQLRAALFASGQALSEGSDTPSFPDCAPDTADVGVDDLSRAADFLRLACGHYAAPLHSSAGAAAATSEDTAVAAMCGASGVGGARVADSPYLLTQMYMQLAAIQLQLASAAPDPAASPALLAARESYMRAVNASRASASGKPWALALLGVGRTLWVQQDFAGAESVLSEANVLDNQNGVIWGWLALLCLRARPVRDREAATAMDQAVKQGLYGDTVEATELLQLLADRYVSLGQSQVAISLLRRAVATSSVDASVSGASLALAKLEARLALANALLQAGAVEDAQAQFRMIAESTPPSTPTALRGAMAALEGMTRVRADASSMLQEIAHRLTA